MSSDRFYRGSTRSPFGVHYIAGSVTAGTDKGIAPLVVVLANVDVRVKRLAVTIMIPKNSNNNKGWLAFLRTGADEVTATADLDIDNPAILRPKVYVSNPDHAIYEQLYLEAINLAPEEKVFLLAFGELSGGASLQWAAKWYAEESYHG